MRLPELRSPIARAVVPVLGGGAVIALIAGFTWVMAGLISSGTTTTTEFAARELLVGNVDDLAQEVATNGPLFLPELGTAIGTRSIVIDHTGTDATSGWRVYWAYPADADATCIVEQVVGTDDFVDCNGRTITVSDLAPPDAGVVPRVDDRTELYVDLRAAASEQTIITTDITATTESRN